MTTMSKPVGQNTVSGKKLGDFVARIERIRSEKKVLGDDEKLVFAEAVSEGFTAARIREILKIRAMKPHDRQEAEAELDMYLHALGMATEAPLFRAVGLMAVDAAAREQVIEALKQLVPPNGEIIVKIGPQPVRVWRDKDGAAHHADVEEPKAPPSSGAAASAVGPRRAAAEPPDCTDAEAEELGAMAYENNEPITSNPFPFGDRRQAKFDNGWRKAAGSDGMGPDTGDDD